MLDSQSVSKKPRRISCGMEYIQKKVDAFTNLANKVKNINSMTNVISDEKSINSATNIVSDEKNINSKVNITSKLQPVTLKVITSQHIAHHGEGHVYCDYADIKLNAVIKKIQIPPITTLTNLPIFLKSYFDLYSIEVELEPISSKDGLTIIPKIGDLNDTNHLDDIIKNRISVEDGNLLVEFAYSGTDEKFCVPKTWTLKIETAMNLFYAEAMLKPSINANLNNENFTINLNHTIPAYLYLKL
jgi:hypothetical protein